MVNQIVKQFEQTVYKALNHYAMGNSVQIEEMGISISFDGSGEEVVFTLLKADKEGEKITGYNKVTELEYTKGILLRRIDLTGQSIYVPQFIKQILTTLCGANECQKNEIFVNLFPVRGKVVMYLYINKKFVEVLDLKTLLE